MSRGRVGRHAGVWLGRTTGIAGTTVDGLWHATARFRPNGTYRLSVVAKGSRAGRLAHVKLRSDTSGDEQVMSFPVTTDWQRFTGRLTIGNQPDYRLVVGATNTGTIDIQSIAVVREAAPFAFSSGDERRSWEYAGGSYVTSWGIGGSTDFSGVVVGPSPGQGWGLRNRYVALRANQDYSLTFRSLHVRGELSNLPHVSIRNLAGQPTFDSPWQYAAQGQRVDHRYSFRTGNDQGYTLTFVTGGKLAFMVDNIQLRET